jgi:hypothetical protein
VPLPAFASSRKSNLESICDFLVVSDEKAFARELFLADWAAAG